MMQDPDTADIYLCILISSGDIVSFCIYDPAGFSGKARDPAFLPIQFHTVKQTGGNGYFLSVPSFCDGHCLCVLTVPCSCPVWFLTSLPWCFFMKGAFLSPYLLDIKDRFLISFQS